MADAQDPLSIPHLIAKRITETASRGTPAALDLAEAISEVTLETVISGANILKLAIIDPDWTIARSGFLDQDQDGLLDAVEVEFPDKSGWFWRLCSVDVTEALNGPNLTLTFEDRIVAYLREHWGPITAKPGTTTAAQFLKQLADEVGRDGKHQKITFVCPQLNTVQPVQADTTSASGTTTVLTPAGSAVTPGKASKKAHRASRTPAEPTPQSWARDLLAAGGWPTTSENLRAVIGWENQEGGHWHNDAKYNPLNTTQPAPGAGNTGTQGNIKVYKSWKQGLDATLKTLQNGKYGPIIAALKAGSDSAATASAISLSLWGTGPAVIPAIARARVDSNDGGTPIELTSATGSGTPQSDVGQLARGSTDNPDEDSWDCMNRIAQQRNWSLFSDSSTLFYMTGPDLIAQHAALIIDRDLLTDDSTGPVSRVGRDRVVSLSGTFDNTAFTSRETTVHKGKVRRKARIQKPASPASVRLDLICDIDEFRGGDVFIFHNYGPLNGRWIVADATRNCLADRHTSLQLAPPTQPTPEPQASSTDTGSTVATGAHGGFNFPMPPGTFVEQKQWTEDQGVDIAAPAHTPLLAVQSGTVVKRGISGFGNDAPVLKLDHSIGGYDHVYYGHAGPAGPKVGEKVKAGAVVGEIGAGIVGISTGPHLEIGFCDANGTPTPGSSGEMFKQLKHSVLTG